MGSYTEDQLRVLKTEAGAVFRDWLGALQRGDALQLRPWRLDERRGREPERSSTSDQEQRSSHRQGKGLLEPAGRRPESHKSDATRLRSGALW